MPETSSEDAIQVEDKTLKVERTGAKDCMEMERGQLESLGKAGKRLK